MARHPEDVADRRRALETAARTELGDAVPALYPELRQIARGLLARERPGHTLEPTALVHELYLRFERRGAVTLQDRGHFLALAAAEMRRALVAHARRKKAAKRGDGATRLALSDWHQVADEAVTPSGSGIDVLALEQVLERLADHDAEACRLVELRYFAGLTVAEIAELVAKTERTVFRRLAWAKAWLEQQLGEAGADGAG